MKSYFYFWPFRSCHSESKISSIRFCLVKTRQAYSHSAAIHCACAVPSPWPLVLPYLTLTSAHRLTLTWRAGSATWPFIYRQLPVGTGCKKGPMGRNDGIRTLWSQHSALPAVFNWEAWPTSNTHTPYNAWHDEWLPLDRLYDPAVWVAKIPPGAPDAGSPKSTVDFKKWRCPVALLLQCSCRF